MKWIFLFFKKCIEAAEAMEINHKEIKKVRLRKEITLDQVHFAWKYLYRHRQKSFYEYCELLKKNNYIIV